MSDQPSSELGPMPEYLRKFAELHEQGKTPEEIAEELGVSVTTVKQKYMYLYRKYIDEAAKLLADGAPEDVVMGELGITRKMMEEAAKKAFKRIQKQVEAIKKESESAQERIQKELQEAGVGGGAPSEVKGRYKELLEEIRSMKTVLDELAKYAVPPTPPSPRPPSPSAPSAPSTQQVLQPEIAKLREKLESLEKNIMQYIAAPYTGRIKKYVVYPDGRVGPLQRHTVHLDNTPSNQVVVSGTLTGARMGLYRLMYQLVRPRTSFFAPWWLTSGNDSVQASGTESFDFGPGSLGDLTTEREAYTGTTEAVQVSMDIYSLNAQEAQIILSLDSGAVSTKTVALIAGYQTVTATLDPPIPVGRRLLEARLEIGEYWDSRQVGFDYGTSEADLWCNGVSVADGGPVTRTVSTLVGNSGSEPADPSIVRFYDGRPDLGGTLIGTATLDALAPFSNTFVSTVWEIGGEGGEHLLYVEVEPVPEFDTANNATQITVTLPRLDGDLTVVSPHIVAGEPLTFIVYLANLQGAASLPVTTFVEIRSPMGETVYSETRTLTLAGGEQRWEEFVWNSDPTAQAGVYAVIQETVDAYGEQEAHGDGFMLEEAAPCAGAVGVTLSGPPTVTAAHPATFTAVETV